MIKNTNFWITLVAGLLWLLPASAQKLSKEEFRTKQKEYFIQQAGLTPDETARFFPLYYELQDKKMEMNKEAWKTLRKGKEPNTSETEYNAIVESVIQSRIAVDQLDLEYLKKFKGILSAKKIYLLQRAEIKFHREILRNFQKK